MDSLNPGVRPSSGAATQPLTSTGRITPPPQPSTKNRQPPPGWWSLADLSGSLEAVLRAIDAADDADRQVPAHWKAAIKADLVALCTDGKNFVWLDAHYHLEGANGVLHYHAVAEKKLL